MSEKTNYYQDYTKEEVRESLWHSFFELWFNVAFNIIYNAIKQKKQDIISDNYNYNALYRYLVDIVDDNLIIIETKKSILWKEKTEYVITSEWEIYYQENIQKAKRELLEDNKFIFFLKTIKNKTDYGYEEMKNFSDKTLSNILFLSQININLSKDRFYITETWFLNKECSIFNIYEKDFEYIIELLFWLEHIDYIESLL